MNNDFNEIITMLEQKKEKTTEIPHDDFNDIISILTTNKEKTTDSNTISLNSLNNEDFDSIIQILSRTKQDKLTGLLNAEQFKEDFNHVLKEADNGLFDVTLIMTDIDEFKKVNDNFGHQIGDDVIKKLAEVLNKINCSHQVYRYSGDSFAIICPKVEKETVFLLMEEVRKTFAEDELCKQVSVTMCAGIATYPEDGANETEILRKADGALYRAKTSGRNKICIAKEEKLITKTAHYTVEQLKKLKDLSEASGVGEAALMREALDELFKKYDQMKKADKPKVLIIDDAAFMRMMVKDILEKNGFEIVAEAADGIEGVEKFEKYNPDFTILDISMPNMDGITLLKTINKQESNKIIILTAMEKREFFLDSVKYGADAFIVKPFQADYIVDVMKQLDEYKIKPEYYPFMENIIPNEDNYNLSQKMIEDIIDESREKYNQ